MKKFIAFNLPLFLVGWWMSTLFIVEKVSMLDGYVTLVCAFLIWICGKDVEKDYER